MNPEEIRCIKQTLVEHKELMKECDKAKTIVHTDQLLLDLCKILENNKIGTDKARSLHEELLKRTQAAAEDNLKETIDKSAGIQDMRDTCKTIEESASYLARQFGNYLNQASSLEQIMSQAFRLTEKDEQWSTFRKRFAADIKILGNVMELVRKELAKKKPSGRPPLEWRNDHIYWLWNQLCNECGRSQNESYGVACSIFSLYFPNENHRYETEDAARSAVRRKKSPNVKGQKPS